MAHITISGVSRANRSPELLYGTGFADTGRLDIGTVDLPLKQINWGKP
jgi:hypothetical protein